MHAQGTEYAPLSFSLVLTCTLGIIGCYPGPLGGLMNPPSESCMLCCSARSPALCQWQQLALMLHSPFSTVWQALTILHSVRPRQYNTWFCTTTFQSHEYQSRRAGQGVSSAGLHVALLAEAKITAGHLRMPSHVNVYTE